MCNKYDLKSRASAVRPAIDTATWSSIGRIFFWWADNSDAALCKDFKNNTPTIQNRKLKIIT